MKFTPNLASLHAYLCADGYVITNPPTQKHVYYHIGLRNTCLELLEDFQRKFEQVFKLRPHMMDGRCKIGSKKIYFLLTAEFSFYSREWTLPSLSRRSLVAWLRSFYDCEGWVEVQPRKSRLIGVESINYSGLLSIKNALFSLGILSGSITPHKNRSIWRLSVCGKENLQRFQQRIGFLHPLKKKKLEQALLSYKIYRWVVPTDRKGLNAFLRKRARPQERRNTTRFYSVHKKNLLSLKTVLGSYGVCSRLCGPWTNQYGSRHYYLEVKGTLHRL